MAFRNIIIATVLLACDLAVSAMPAMPVRRAFTQSDGTSIVVTLKGDEFCHYYQTDDGHIVTMCDDGNLRYSSISGDGKYLVSDIVAHEASLRDVAERTWLKNVGTKIESPTIARGFTPRRANAVSKKVTAFPNKGEVHGLIILAEFADMPFSTNLIRPVISAQMNDENYTLGGATGSARDYFMDQSGGQFRPVFDVYGPVKLPGTIETYGKNKSGRGDDADAPQMVVDACSALRNEIDFSLYDYDNDGDVDLVFIIYSGYNEAQGGGTNTIWPHAWDIYQGKKSLKLNGKNIRKYACTSELRGFEGNTIDGIGTFCHEFSHCLGLPDLYDSRYTGYVGLEYYDLMDKGGYNNESRTPPYMSLYERAFIGWAKPKELTAPGPYTLRHLTDGYTITNPHNPDEYFTFENRQPVKWDTALPNHGLMISHVDYNEQAWGNNVVNSKDGGPHAHLQIVPANNMLSDATDALFPGKANNTRFTDSSRPTAKFWTGNFVGKPITGIRVNDDGTVKMNFCTYIPAPVAAAASDITDTSATANWEMAENASAYNVICNSIVSGKKVYTHEINQEGLLLNPGDEIILPYQTFANNTHYTVHLSAVAETSVLNGLGLQLLDDDYNEVLKKSYTVRDYKQEQNWEIETIESGFVTISNNTYDKPITLHSVELYSGKVAADLKEGKQPEVTGTEHEITVAGVVDGCSATISGLHPDTDYLYSIVAYNEDNDTESRPSNKILFTTTAPSSLVGVYAAAEYVLSATNGAISISTPYETAVTIANVSGQIVGNHRLPQGATLLPLESGIYIIALTDQAGNEKHEKIVVR